ncbi:MAG: DNA mismatch repair endonuclease MutL [Oscillospiraceae bacterium]|nr:DNA mismatch repair endonuclease MutL [Oscillospiraceae bacterium]
MAKIIQLDPHVADLIAAGEVVERPASVVKELIENSIDAGANDVTVEIKGGGMTFIRVSDNGCGIPADEAETAFLRHATSKLRDERGLEAIGTLGFRGEALAAIASVSRVELVTRERGCAEGLRLALEGGAVTSKNPAGCPDGTTIIVRDLFYNTPARLKFMKTDRAESSGVAAAALRCALSHPEVSVRYIRDGAEEFHTPGDGRVDSCVYTLFGRDFAAGMLEAGTSDGDVAVTGYVSTPAAAKGNRTGQYFFVNGRFVKSKTLQAALEQAYRNTLFTGRYPQCVLYISLSPSAVDVNVHPAKTEVKFLNERQVFDGVYYAALGALENRGPAQNADVAVSPSTMKVLGGPPDAAEGKGAASPRPAGRQYAAPPHEASVKIPKASFKEMSSEEFINSFVSGRSAAPQKRGRQSPVSGGTYRPGQTELDMPDIPAVAPDTQRPAKTAKAPAGARLIGEALDTYIIVESGDSLWLIDKHAAHERVCFDRLRSQQRETMVEQLLTPVIFSPGPEDAALLAENASVFETFGISLELLGDSSVAVRSIPSYIDESDVEALLGESCAALRSGGTADPSRRRDEILHSVACKAAIKAGRRSEPEELSELAERVLSGEIRYCPHGRPVAVELTHSALDRTFKRT